MAVSIEQAAANAAVAYIRTKFTGIPINTRWPKSDFSGKAITLITAGARRDESIQTRVLGNTPMGGNQTRALWQLAECSQPFQLDVWATTHADRTDILANLDVVLRAGFNSLPWVTLADPFQNGFFVQIGDGWSDLVSTTAHFVFENPDYDDTPDGVNRSQYRATYRGTAYMKLALPATTARITRTTLKAYLDGDTRPSTDTLIQ